MEGLELVQVGGVAMPLFVALVVELLKLVKVVKTSDHARLANLVVSALFALAWVFVALEPQTQAALIVSSVIGTLYNVLASALAYNQTLGKYG